MPCPGYGNLIDGSNAALNPVVEELKADSVCDATGTSCITLTPTDINLSATNVLVNGVPISSIGQSGWLFTNLLSGDPGAGNIRTDNILPLNVSSVGISVTDNNGSSQRPILESMSTGDSLYLCDPLCTNAKLYTITSTPVDNTSWFFITVNLSSQSDTANYVALDLITVDFINAANSLQQAYQASVAPQITVDDFLGPLEIKNDQTLQTDKTLDLLDDMDVSVFSVDGNGLIKSEQTDNYNSTVSTGLVGGGILSIGTPTTTFSMAAGRGIVQTSTPLSSTAITTTQVDWTAFTNVTATYVVSNPVSYIGINASGSIVQSATNWTNIQHRSIIAVGTLIHPVTTVVAVATDGMFIQQPSLATADLSKSIGKLNVSGNGISNPYASFKWLKSAGTIYSHNSNYENDPNDPSIVQSAEVDTNGAGRFAYIFQDGSQAGNIETDIVPDRYDDGTPYPGASYPVSSKYGTSRVHTENGSLLFVSPPQKVDYNSLEEAREGIATETFVLPASLSDALLIGYIITQGSAANLQASGVEFISVGKFGATSSAGQVISTLQTSYNSSTQPQIVTDTTRHAVVFQNGDANNTLNVLEIKDIGGSISASINGNGNIDSDGGYLYAGQTGQLVLDGQGGFGTYVVGNNAGSALTTETNNILFGTSAGQNLTATQNIGIGSNTLRDVTENNNVAIGNSAHVYGTGDCNIAIGSGSQLGDIGGSTTGNNNVSVGCTSLTAVTTGSNNACLGNNAGNVITTGSSNSCIGNNAGNAITTGTGNTCLGTSADVDDAGGDYRIALGFNAEAKENQQMMIGSTDASTTITEIVPGRDGECDLGSSTNNKFKDLYLSGDIDCATVIATGNITADTLKSESKNPDIEIKDTCSLAG